MSEGDDELRDGSGCVTFTACAVGAFVFMVIGFAAGCTATPTRTVEVEVERIVHVDVPGPRVEVVREVEKIVLVDRPVPVERIVEKLVTVEKIVEKRVPVQVPLVVPVMMPGPERVVYRDRERVVYVEVVPCWRR